MRDLVMGYRTGLKSQVGGSSEPENTLCFLLVTRGTAIWMGRKLLTALTGPSSL